MGQHRCGQAGRSLRKPAENPSGDTGGQDRREHGLSCGARVGDVREPEGGGLQHLTTGRAECVGTDLAQRAAEGGLLRPDGPERDSQRQPSVRFVGQRFAAHSGAHRRHRRRCRHTGTHRGCGSGPQSQARPHRRRP
ncbi:hypothetical protein BKG61_28485 [Mycobacterium syngnathidarum]|uniref:Uncharacterized protein n=1 Tax=Mycobacterium syngnathidarum TaxID=1908205 RepID=A0A1S1JKS1_9MYCO|nr:hypothetical protein BKG61_28485 [Mycobacterium syngnathidarum]